MCPLGRFFAVLFLHVHIIYRRYYIRGCLARHSGAAQTIHTKIDFPLLAANTTSKTETDMGLVLTAIWCIPSRVDFAPALTAIAAGKNEVDLSRLDFSTILISIQSD